MSDDSINTSVIIPKTGWGAFVERYTSRGFVMAGGLEIVGCYGFLHHLMSDVIFLSFSGMISALYAAHSVTDKRLNGAP